nr:hypothetical protein [Tanacetum cinerariifolium]
MRGGGFGFGGNGTKDRRWVIKKFGVLARYQSLTQSSYFDKILKKLKMENSKRGSVLMQEKPGYRKSQGAQTPSEVKLIQRVHYALAIGSIMYVTDKDDTKSQMGPQTHSSPSLQNPTPLRLYFRPHHHCSSSTPPRPPHHLHETNIITTAAPHTAATATNPTPTPSSSSPHSPLPLYHVQPSPPTPPATNIIATNHFTPSPHHCRISPPRRPSWVRLVLKRSKGASGFDKTQQGFGVIKLSAKKKNKKSEAK